MAYVGRMFFSKDNGELIYRYETQGDITVSTGYQDLENIQALRDYGSENIEVIEIAEENTEIRQKIYEATSISLDTKTKELIFDFTPPDPVIEYEPIDEEKVAMAETIIALETRINELEGALNA